MLAAVTELRIGECWHQNGEKWSNRGMIQYFTYFFCHLVFLLLPCAQFSCYTWLLIVLHVSTLFCKVDEYSQSSVPSIWAVGDVTDRINLTPVALMEGGALAKTLFQNEPTKPDYR